MRPTAFLSFSPEPRVLVECPLMGPVWHTLWMDPQLRVVKNVRAFLLGSVPLHPVTVVPSVDKRSHRRAGRQRRHTRCRRRMRGGRFTPPWFNSGCLPGNGFPDSSSIHFRLFYVVGGSIDCPFFFSSSRQSAYPSFSDIKKKFWSIVCRGFDSITWPFCSWFIRMESSRERYLFFSPSNSSNFGKVVLLFKGKREWEKKTKLKKNKKEDRLDFYVKKCAWNRHRARSQGRSLVAYVSVDMARGAFGLDMERACVFVSSKTTLAPTPFLMMMISSGWPSVGASALLSIHFEEEENASSAGWLSLMKAPFFLLLPFGCFFFFSISFE